MKALDGAINRQHKKAKRTCLSLQRFSWQSGSSSQLCIPLLYHPKLDGNFKKRTRKLSGESGITGEQVGERVFIREIKESMFVLSLHCSVIQETC